MKKGYNVIESDAGVPFFGHGEAHVLKEIKYVRNKQDICPQRD